MNPGRHLRARSSASLHTPTLLLIPAVATVIALSGCGGSSTPPPPVSGNTAVTVALTSTSNDSLQQYSLGFTSLSLTRSDGTVAVLLTAQPDPGDAFSSVDPEFIHRNGSYEPLVTVSVPEGEYTSATATFDTGVFTCVAPDPVTGGLSVNEYADQGDLQNVNVNLAAPITITGTSMALALNLQVPQSASFASCFQSSFPEVYSLTPTFTLAPMTAASAGNASSSVSFTNYDAEISSVAAGGSLTVTPAFDPFSAPISVATDSSTTYQGIQASSTLAAGMFVNMDLAIQADGSLAATRVNVENPSAVAFATGPILFACGTEPCLQLQALASQGTNLIVPYGYGSYFSLDSATFSTYPGYSNIAQLPFTATFSAATLAAGQQVYLTTGTPNLTGGYPYTEANTVTLVPQTINGTVDAVSQDGNFAVYTVTLADYDLFPSLAVQPGQNTVLTSPNSVQVYVDSSAQKLNTAPITSGSVLRFTGLVFNDGGTLRMDAAQVNDGVPE